MEAARAWARGGPSAQDLQAAAAWGLTAADYAEAPIEIWPDNWPAVRLFADLGTQWRTGPAGPIGLDYAALPAVMDLRAIPADERGALFDDLQTLEAAALKTFSELRT